MIAEEVVLAFRELKRRANRRRAQAHSDDRIVEEIRAAASGMSTGERIKAIRSSALKILKETPERHQRERLYQALDHDNPSLTWSLREAMGDEDGSRDTQGEP